jgi:hypothetical protein
MGMSHYRPNESVVGVNLMLVLNRSLLNKEYNLINVLQALVTTISACSLHVFFFSKITQKYFTVLASCVFPLILMRKPRVGANIKHNTSPINASIVEFYCCEKMLFA